MAFPIKIVSTQKPDILEIRWNPNNVCNFKCRYCFPESNIGTYTSPKDLDLIVRNFDHFLTEYKEKLGKTTVHLKIAGGEPTLWRELGDFIERIKKLHNIYLTVISNGSRTIRWWKKYGHLIDNVTLSYHQEQAKIDHHIEVADVMFDLGKKTTVVVLMDPLRWNECVQDIEYMKKNSKYKWFIQTAEVIEQEHVYSQDQVTERKYTEEQKKYMNKELKRIPGPAWFLKNIKLVKDGMIRMHESVATLDDGSTIKARPQTYINNNWNSFYGWSCDIGSEAVFINWTGEIIGSCQQKLYGLDFSYNILDEDFVNKFVLNFKPVICQYKNCFCGPETHVSKRKLS